MIKLEKIKLKVNDLFENMVVAMDIFDDNKNIVLYKDTVLTKYLIKLLKSLNLNKVYVKENEKFFLNNIKLFEETYKNSVYYIKKFFKLFEEENNLNENLVNEITNLIYSCKDSKKLILDIICKEIPKKEYMFNHTLNVALTSMLIAKWIDKNETFIKDLIKASILHDVGLLKIPKSIIEKDELDEINLREYKKHPLIGFKGIKDKTNFSKDIQLAVLMHHEKENGLGYPNSYKRDEIHFYAKILAVVEFYNEMITKRVNRSLHNPFKVMELLNRSISIYDQSIVKMFLDNVLSHYVGYKVMLSDGQLAEVMYINDRNLSSPIVKINNDVLDLSNSKELDIVQIIIG
jgi:HD-GYP domain-containing protein (c-di-GMP phosphodiesterase class II)